MTYAARLFREPSAAPYQTFCMTMTDRLTPMPDAPVRLMRTGRAHACAIATTSILPQRAMRVSPRRISAPPDSARFPA